MTHDRSQPEHSPSHWRHYETDSLVLLLRALEGMDQPVPMTIAAVKAELHRRKKADE
jgi:hypothetical protein